MSSELKVGCGCASAAALFLSLIVGVLLLGPLFFLLPGLTAVGLWALWRWLKKEMPVALGDRPVEVGAKPAKAPEGHFRGTTPRSGLENSSPPVRRPPSRDVPVQPALRFVYVDKSENVTQREVIDWIEEDDRFTGYCVDVDAERTFLKASVLEWLDGTDRLLNEP
ncbi:hypothetical protein [Brevundimonas sp.]|uniref:hypothetical protein n=1 Tax=Brevundimonas sp. TaxID=1871086 RepID=UPI00258026BF|nr:hypothetical protein [Brevundimonas sp.]